MTWTWQVIQRDWLVGSRVAASPGEAVDAFNLVEDSLGREWLESQRNRQGVRTGSLLVADVIGMGQRLQAVQHALGLEGLLHRIRSGEDSAEAELTAAYLCLVPGTGVALEFCIPDQVSDGKRVPDFRLRQHDESWTYVEVTAPNTSDMERQAKAFLDYLATSVLAEIPLGDAAEVIVRRDPSQEEAKTIVELVRAQLQVPGTSRRDLHGLALVLVRHAQPGKVVLENYGEPVGPQIGMVRLERRGEQARQVAIRYAFADQRAATFLASEARQLPQGTPGLIMMDLSRAAGAFEVWEPLLTRRLQPQLHTRVSAIVLFRSASRGLAEGEAWVPHTRVVENTYAVHHAPKWLLEKQRSWAAPW